MTNQMKLVGHTPVTSQTVLIVIYQAGPSLQKYVSVLPHMMNLIIQTGACSCVYNSV